MRLLLSAESKSSAVEAFAEDEHPVIRFLVGLHPTSSEQVRDKLVSDPVPWMKESVAFNSSAQEALLLRLHACSELGVLRALACNPSTPKAVQLQLASHSDRRTRIMLANHSRDEDVWRALIESVGAGGAAPTWETQLEKALDPSSTEAELEELRFGVPDGLFERADGPYWKPDGTLSFSHAGWWSFKRSEAALEDASWSGVEALHRAIIRHPAFPAARAAHHYGPFIGDEVAQPSGAFPALAGGDPMSIPYGAPKLGLLFDQAGWFFSLASGLAPSHVARAYLTHEDAKLRAAAAGCLMNTPGRLLELAFDKNAAVRTAIATRPDLNGFLISVLREDTSKRVLKQLDANEVLSTGDREAARVAVLGGTKRAASAEARSALWSRVRDADCSASDLDELSVHTDPCVRYATALHPSASSRVLEQIASDEVAWVRVGAGYNPSSPPELLEAMVGSGAYEARLAVASNPSCPESLQLVLAADEDRRIRYRVADHARSPAVWRTVIAHRPRGSGRLTFEEMLEEALEPATTRARLYYLQGSQRPIEEHFERTYPGREGSDVGAAIPQWVGALSVSRAVARHPRCPNELLSRYGFYLPEDVSANESFGLAVLENPDFVAPMGTARFHASLANGNGFGYLVNACIGSEIDVERRAAARSDHADLGRLQLEVLSDDALVRRELARRGEINRFMFEALRQDPDAIVRRAIESREDFSTWVALTAVSTPESDTSRVADQNDDRRPNRKRSKAPTAAARARLAAGANDPAVLHDMRADGSYKVRLAVAQNRATSFRTLQDLVGDQRREVQRAAMDLAWGRRAQATLDEIETFGRALLPTVDDEDPAFRAAAARLVVDEQALRQLLRDPKPSVRRAAASNPGLGETLQLELVQETPGDSAIRKGLASETASLSVFKALLDDDELLHDLSRNRRCQLDRETILLILGSEKYEALRSTAYLAAEANGDPPMSTVFEALTSQEKEWAAARIKGPVELLAELSRDTSPTLRAAVASNGNTPAEVLSRLARDPEERVREGAALNQQLSDEDALRLATDSSYQVRESLMSFPRRRSSEVLQVLARQGSRFVNETARQELATRGHDDSSWEQGLSLTKMLRRKQIGISAKKANALLVAAGIIEVRTRASSSDPTKTRSYKALTAAGERFGHNKASDHTEETSPAYYPSRFDELVEKYLGST